MISRGVEERERERKRERDRCQAAGAREVFYKTPPLSFIPPLRERSILFDVCWSLYLSRFYPFRRISLPLAPAEQERTSRSLRRGGLRRAAKHSNEEQASGGGWRRRQSSLSRESVGEHRRKGAGPREAADSGREKEGATPRGAGDKRVAERQRAREREKDRDRERASLFDVDATGLAQNSCSVLVERRRAATGSCRRALRHRSTDLRYAREKENYLS